MSLKPSPPSCTFCSTAPAPHALLWFDTAASLYFDRPLRYGLKPFVILLTPFVRWLTNSGMHIFFTASRALGLTSFQEEIAVKELHRKEVMYLEARKRGIRMQAITFLKKEVPYARAWLPVSRESKHHAWHYFEHIPIPPWRDAPLWQNLDNKLELKELFKKEGVRVARGAAFSSEKKAVELFKELQVPVIVKPLEGSRARHTRVRVTEENDFRAAFKSAKQICPEVLVEEFVKGDVHRLTCIDGKLVAAMRFVRPTIATDGKSTAEELRTRYNEALSLSGVSPVAHNELFTLTLLHQGLSEDDIPPAGTLRLADFSERANGGYNEDVTTSLSQKRIAEIEKAAVVSGLSLVGFDAISKNIKDDAEELVFLEANTAPFIEIHHEPTLGAPQNVASAVWDLWLANK